MSGRNLITAARASGFKNIVLNAGALFVGFDPSLYTTTSQLRAALGAAIQDESMCLGITKGGGSFKTSRAMRQIEADGLRYRYVGDTVTDSIDATLNFTFVELSNGNIARGLTAVNVTTSGQVTKFVPRTRIVNEDYIQNLTLAADYNDEGVLVICLKNALNTSDFTLAFTDKGEVNFPLEFHAYQDSLDDFDTAPYAIYHFEGDTITLNKSTTSIVGTATETLTATTSPAGATVTWASSNTAVATVSDAGVVTGVAAGTAVITASLASGPKAKCTVTVTAAQGTG